MPPPRNRLHASSSLGLVSRCVGLAEGMVRMAGEILHDTWYTDASGINPALPPLRVVSWSAVQLSAQGF
eukprot:4913580-Amphidinium_carterae.1